MEGFNFFEQQAQQQEELLTVEKIAVNNDDFREENGFDYGKTFLQSDFDEEWELKPLINIESTTGKFQDNIASRQVNKKLPDVKRKGKRFHYISSGNANTCPALNLFFELNKEKKEGNALSEALIKEFMGSSREAGIIVQVQNAPEKHKDKIGECFILPFANDGGDTAHIEKLIDLKLNPKSKREKRINIFDMFFSPILYLICEKKMYDKKEGRTFASSSFSTTNDISPLIEVDGKLINFTADDVTWAEKTIQKEDGTKETIKYVTGFKDPKYLEGFNKLLEKLKNPDISMSKKFSYRALESIDKEDSDYKYLEENHEKMREAVKLIRNAKSVEEVLKAIGSDNSRAEGEVIGGANAQDLLKNSALDALNNGALGVTNNTTETATTTTTNTNQNAVTDFSNLLNNPEKQG